MKITSNSTFAVFGVSAARLGSWRRAAARLLVVCAAASLVSGSLVVTASAATSMTGNSSELHLGGSLQQGQALTSPSGAFSATLQSDGNLVVENNGNPIWASGTSSTSPSFNALELKSNGDLGVFSSIGNELWSAGTSGDDSSYLVMRNSGALSLVSGTGLTLWSSESSSGSRSPRSSPRTSPSPVVYTPGEFYGGTNPSALCFTCQAVDATGTAPPSSSIDSGAGVDSLTGDFTTSTSLFDARALGSDLAVTLSYDAQLAQAEIASGQGMSGSFGWGWNSTFGISVTPQTPSGSTTPQLVVNQASGAQLVFSQSANSGTSTSCPTGDQASVNWYTANWYPVISTNYFTSTHNWCALANVQGQVGDWQGQAIVYEQKGGQSVDMFNWNGSLSETGTTASLLGKIPAGVSAYYNVAPGSMPSVHNTTTQSCPTGVVGCTIYESWDGRDIVEVLNSNGQVVEIIDPSGVAYTLSFDAHNNLVGQTNYANRVSPSTWHYVYDTSAPSPNMSDLVQIYNPDSGVGTSPAVNPGAAHSAYVSYNNSGADVGMVNSLEDGTGATTSYTYLDPCAAGQCLGALAPQQTTVTYPAEVPCPSCTAQSPVEVDTYAAGVQTSTSLGSPTNPYNNEAWQYSWNLGYGATNSVETITYPNSLSGSALTASLTLDPEGNLISTTDTLGHVATSAFAPTPFPEMLWSFPGASANGPYSPPAGSSVFTYNAYGEVLTAADPLGNVTRYAYYLKTPEMLCNVAPPTVGIAGYCPGDGGTGLAYPNTTIGAGSTNYTYDAYGDAYLTTVDEFDASSTPDTKVTVSGYDVMGNLQWWIPSPGQGGVWSSANPYATSWTYAPSNLPLTVTKPGQGTTTNTYDADLNLVGVQTSAPGVYVTTAFDHADRPCYELTGAQASGLTCSSSSQAGSKTTSYVPGTTTVSSTTDGNGQTTSYYYGDLAYPSSPTESVDPAGQSIQYTAYNDYGNVCVTGPVSMAIGTATQCNALGGDTTTINNALGNETSVTDPSGNTTTYAYANAAYPTLVTSSTNALGQTTSYTYDADGRLTKTTNPDGGSVATTYDADSRVCNRSDNGSAYACGTESGVAGVTSYVYNGASDRTAMTVNPLGFGARQLSAGAQHSCALLTSGTVNCWGSNVIGQLGNRSDNGSAVPVAVSGLTGVTQVSTSDDVNLYDSSCALLTNTTVTCWGYNSYGQLGNGTTTNSPVPVAVSGLTGVTQIASAYDHSCALLSNGTVQCWGQGAYGELGNGTTTSSSVPVAVSGLTGVTQISVGFEYSCALLTSGSVDCWGYNAYGQLGNGNDYTESLPGTVLGLSGVAKLSAGEYDACAVLANGTVDCWGSNSNGQLGNGTNTGSSGATPVGGLSGVTQISVGSYHTCALLTAGTIECWGSNAAGDYGNGTTTTSFVPVAVSGVSGVTQISAGYQSTCAVFVTGVAKCWGYNQYGQLGNGNWANSATPAQVAPLNSNLTTHYTYANGQLTGVTDSNLKTVSYMYNFAGQVACLAYPVSATSSCGTIASPAVGSTTNTIATRSYDAAGRLASTADWLGNTVQYTYNTLSNPGTPSRITYPTLTGLVANYGFNNNGQVSSMTAGSNINDTWSYDVDGRLNATTVNGVASSVVAYNANNQITAATNLAASTSNDTYTIAPNGAITGDTAPGGATTSSGYNAGGQLCWSANVAASSSSCTSPPTSAPVLTNYTYTANGQRASATTTTGSGTTTGTYAWDPYGRLCNTSPVVVTCGSTPASGTAYTYDGDGLRMTAQALPTSGPSTTTISTWDVVSGGAIPLNVNDMAVTSGVTTNTSYLYGDLLFGGTAPVEQITTTGSGSTATFLASTPSGVQGGFSSTGASLEQALYSTYGVQTIMSGTKTTPFGFQGSYTDPTGLIYLINRYYNPSTDQFLSVRPDGRPDGPAVCVRQRQSVECDGPDGVEGLVLHWSEVLLFQRQ